MLHRPDTVEQLREALISLARSRRRERELRVVEASMANVVRVLALAENQRETLDSLLEALRVVLPFQEAAILTRAPGEEAFTPAARTCEWLSALRLRPGRMLERVLGGEIVVTFDANLVEEWREQTREVQARSRSVIHVPLRSGAGAVLLVCTHAEAARFEQRHIDVVTRLVPLVGQILQKLDLRQVLAAREKERRERLAIFDAIVDHIHAGVLVEDDRRRVFAANDLLRAMFGREASGEELIGSDAVALHARFARLTDDPEAISERTDEIARERALASGERIRLASGRVVERDYVPVATADGQFIAHFWQYRDVTAHDVAGERVGRARPRPSSRVNH